MADIYKPSSSTTYSYDGGHYRFKLNYAYSNNAFTFNVTLTITDATKSAHYHAVKWKDEAGNWQNFKSTKTHKAKGSVTTKTFMTTAEALEVQMLFGSDGWKTASVTPTINVSTPNISAELKNDALMNLTITGNASSSRYVNKMLIERKEDNGSWSSLVELTDNYTNDYVINHSDTTITTGHYYSYRVKAYKDSVESAYSSETPSIYTTPTSTEISGSVSATRTNNTTVSVAWALSSVTPVQLGLVQKFVLMKSINGGAYDDIKTVEANTTNVNYTATDTNCSKDNTYRYAVDIINKDGKRLYAPIISDDIIKMTPAEPQYVSLALNSNNEPVITLKNSSNSATNVLFERKEGTGSWTQEAEEDYPCESYTGDAVTAGTTVYYRVRNYVDDSSITPASDKYSGYSNAGTGGGAGGSGVSIDTTSKPNAPTLIEPYNGSKYKLDEGTVRLSWTHNATDGSSQEAARVQYKVGSGSWTTVNVTTNQYYDLSLSSFSAGNVITWKVSTKGANASYSDYSSEKTFTLLAKPTISFTSPSNAAVISTLPIQLTWAYSDLSGTLTSLTAEIVKDNKSVMTIDVPVGTGQSGTYNYTLSDFLPDNNSQYSITVYALSSSGLSASQTISITIQYTNTVITGGLIPTVFFDAETSYATIQIMRDITEGASPATISTAYLYRVSDGETELVASGLNERSTVVDKYAPIHIDYTYKLMQITSLGAVGVTEVTVKNDSPYWFILWGDSIARARWNPEGSASITRPDRTEVRYSGRKFPVSYDSNAQEETYSFSAVINERDDLNAFRQLMRDGGQGIWKSGDGECYNANFKFSYSSSFTTTTQLWNATLEVMRIE